MAEELLPGWSGPERSTTAPAQATDFLQKLHADRRKKKQLDPEQVLKPFNTNDVFKQCKTKSTKLMRKCKTCHNTLNFTMHQTRSGDEGMTSKWFCDACNTSK